MWDPGKDVSGQISQQLRTLAALVEDLSLVPSIYNRWLSPLIPSPGESNTLSVLHGHLHICGIYIYSHVKYNKILKVISWLIVLKP